MSDTPREVLVLNGPNLGRLGTRQPLIYGATTYAELVALCEKAATECGFSADVRQTDDEAQMLGWLHEAADREIPVVLNPASWSHYSLALHDACAMLSAPLIEVHISNIHTREQFRHHSVVSATAVGVIAGLGVDGYAAAIRWVADNA